MTKRQPGGQQTEIVIANGGQLPGDAAARLRETLTDALAQQRVTTGQAVVDVGTTTWDTIGGVRISNPPFRPAPQRPRRGTR